jgi:hypothetical protein
MFKELHWCEIALKLFAKKNRLQTNHKDDGEAMENMP